MGENLLTNAGFLDGTDGWTFTGSTLAVDETVYGRAGRVALVGSSTSAAPNENAVLRTDSSHRVAVTAGVEVEAFGAFWASHGTPALKLFWFTSGGSLITNDQVTTQQVVTHAPKRGRTWSMCRAWDVKTPPPTAAFAELRLLSTIPSSGTNYKLVLMKPFIGAPRDEGFASLWDPGVMANDDLAAVDFWPSELPFFLSGSQSKPFANRSSFGSDSNIPATSLMYETTQFEFRGKLKLTQDQYDVLDDFYDGGSSRFWVVQPDTEKLCYASWLADGRPTITDNEGPTFAVDVGLKLRVS